MLIGRHADLERIDRLVDAAREGRSGALLVAGEPGIGKTALLDHARRHATVHDLTVLDARGIEAELELPYAGLSELVAPLLHLRPRLPPAQAAALGQALALEEGGTPARFAVPAALLGLLGTAAEDRPVLALVDDAQWLDQPSIEAIAFAARRLRDEGVALIVGLRDDDAAQPAPSRRTLDSAGLETLRPQPLSDAEAAELLRTAHGAAVRGAVAADLVAAAAGNPLALLEVPSSLTPGQLSGSEALPAVVPPGESVAQAFRRRLTSLPEETRTALLVVAAGRDEGLAQIVAALAQLDGSTERALEPAEADGVIELDAGRVRFRHPLLRAAAYHLASPPARRAAHRALAAQAPERSPARAWHFAAGVATADEEVAQLLEAAAGDARRRGGHSSAARAFARAAELTPAAPDRARRLMEGALEAQAAGELDRAEALCDQGLALGADDPMVDPLLHRIRASVLIRSGRPDTGLAEMVQAAAALEPAIPIAAAAMLLEAALAQMASGPIRDAIWMGERARDLAAGDRSVQALADAVLGQAHMAVGDPAAAEARLGHAVPVLLRTEPPPGAWDVVALAAHASMWLEEEERATRLLERIVARARADGALAQLAYPLAIRAQLAFRQGRWAEARADAEEAARAARDTGQDTMLAYALGVRTHVEGALGHADDAREHARVGIEVSESSEARVFAPYLHAGLGVLALGEGRPAEAAAHFEAGREAALRMHFTMPGQDVLSPDVVEAYVRAGDEEAARDAYARLTEHLHGPQPYGVVAQFARAEALLAPPGEEQALAFARALREHERSSSPFERARTQLAFGQCLGADRDAARPHLEAAHQAFERLGARRWAERAQEALRGAGLGWAGRRVPLTEALTPHELQVALVVAQGATNKEAAAALFLSPKTVEHHLGQIYRKLELRGRGELAAVVADER